MSIAKRTTEKPICSFYQKGNCKNGDKCNFKHEEPTEVLYDCKEEGICEKFQKDLCPHGEECQYKHVYETKASGFLIYKVVEGKMLFFLLEEKGLFNNPGGKRRSKESIQGCAIRELSEEIKIPEFPSLLVLEKAFGALKEKIFVPPENSLIKSGTLSDEFYMRNAKFTYFAIHVPAELDLPVGKFVEIIEDMKLHPRLLFLRK